MISSRTYAAQRRPILLALLLRLAAAVPVLVGMVIAVFFIAHILPGDPFAHYVSPTLPAAVAEQARRAFGLDQPLGEQFLTWVRHVLVWDFGVSYTTHQSVLSMISQALPVSLILGSSAFIVQVLLALTMALVSVHRPGGRLDRFLSAGGMVLYATPSYFVGILLLAVFSFWLGILPSGHWQSVDASALPPLALFWDRAVHLVLPVAAIAIPRAAAFARYLRSSLLRTLERPFILAARSQGLPERSIIWNHALPNALMSAISLGGLELGTLLTGTLVTETLFAFPGMGRLTVTAVLSRDYPLLVGCTIVSGCLVIVANSIADVLHAALDPRVRTE